MPAADISTALSTGNNAMPQCSFAATGASRGRFALTVNVDTSPSPYFRLERTAVETGQEVTPSRIFPAPEPVAALGLEAYWFPVQSQLMSTDGVRLITVTVRVRHATQARERALAEAVSRPYLRIPHGNITRLLTAGQPNHP